MHSCHIFGLRVQSDWPIAGLAEEAWAGPADVALHSAGGPPPVESGWSLCPPVQSDSTATRLEWSTALGSGGTYLRLRCQIRDRYALFVIDPGGRHVWAEWSEGFPAVGITGLLVSRVLCTVLLRRGVTCLHASAVVIEDRAVAFLGQPGAGKSTTAAALHRRGGVPLADDLVALNESDGPTGRGFLVQTGYPGLKLRLDAARAFCGAGAPPGQVSWDGDDPDARVYLNLDHAGEVPCRRPTRLAAIYLLDARVPSLSRPTVLEVAGADRLMALAPHARARVLLGEAERGYDFAALGRLARSVPIRRVSRPEGLASLPAICDAILEDVAALPALAVTRR